ncbi:MAG: hydrogenobyrinic acid a,c-diamide synthase (glutamine-hydrolyzing) [Rhodobacteraceae bacterium]|nr:hydrogenobyrinic acid a,c-diamide synthase (glutamine-hydrolyzing) [Paracoccaceae bacterium]
MMPRFLIAAAHKSSGKTVISTGLSRALTMRGLTVQTFKKGPDYIDPMWLGLASGRPCYNLDFNTMNEGEVRHLLNSRADGADISIIESNKGLYDGVDLHGADSNAAMAKLTKSPIVLVVDTTGTTRGIAPLLVGYRAFDADVNIAGVILNKTGGPRHEGKLRAAVEEYTDIPVLGAVSRSTELEIGERHLGLTTPSETGMIQGLINTLGRRLTESVDLDALIAIAAKAPDLDSAQSSPINQFAKGIRIGVARDTAFGFYYPDDFEAFEAAGAELVFFDAINDTHLPNIDGLFIGGGFPETSMAKLEANSNIRHEIKQAIKNGLPAYAECGGLMYLCETLEWHGQKHEMVGVIPGNAVMCERPQGRGHTRLSPSDDCLWQIDGGAFKAHEFHYAKVDNLPVDTKFGFDVKRGAGISGAHDGIVVNNLMAGFCHMRNTASNPWVERFLRYVANVKARKNPA